MIRRALAALVCAVVGLALASCSKAPAFHIVAGSEQKSLEPIVLDFCRQKHVECQIDYKGSLDIGLMLDSDAPPDVDAVWPASGIWIQLYDTHHRVKDLRSIAQSPVVLGVRMSKARELGWTSGAPVRMNDILQAVTSHKLSFLMTSATQSNSGASAYLAMLAASFGDGSRLDPAALDDQAALDKVKALLAGVARSSGSSGWLGDLYLRTANEGHPYDGMWNYEFMLKETNDQLRQAGKELLYAVYPAEGSAYADAPLGYVDHGQPKATKDFFDGLQAYLLSHDSQAKVAADGRRTAPGMAAPAPPEPDWNFNPARTVPSVSLPEPPVILRALSLYQGVLRRPSLTVLCLDFSGSMSGDGETQLKAAMSTLFTPGEASRSLIQWSPADHIIIIPFDATPRTVIEGDGDAQSQASMLAQVNAQEADGGTDMYACATEGFRRMAPYLASGKYLPAMVLMTDGRSDESSSFEGVWRSQGHEVPIFGVTFGDAQKDQLNRVADMTRSRVFDGGKNLSEAFRSARGYN